jgi:hypothetical protein
MCFHTPAHKITAKISANFRAARFAAEEAAFRVKWTPEEDEAFDAIPSTTYERADTSWVDRIADSPYNHRDCDVLCAFGPAGIESQWPLFVQAVGYDIGAPSWLPAGSTRRSMFAESGLSVDGKTDLGVRTVDDRICDREWDWYA